ncbi:MAG TPA: transaldolase [Polyangiaceae bacterium]|nr:transaldolase [Polyangiaceae bacterium]
MTPVQQLRDFGQSVWLDYLDHALIAEGELDSMIDRDGITGATSNPTIFQRALASSRDYDALIGNAAPLFSDAAVFEEIEMREVTMACDLFRRVYDATEGADGFVSIEVSPLLAHDAAASIEEARRLWTFISRPNVMIKLPGTREGLTAIEQCLFEGINVNVTLLFSVERYRQVIDAYLRALERRVVDGKAIDRVASVASFFVSRVDTKVDRAIDAISEGHGWKDVPRGRAAIANAELAYREYTQSLATERWRRLAARGARPQRVLWASTSTKNPAYPPLYYAEALVGPGTIDTMTRETLRTYLSQGHPRIHLGKSIEEARVQSNQLAALGVDFAQVTRELEEEGIEAFSKSYAQALSTVAKKRQITSSVTTPD